MDQQLYKSVLQSWAEHLTGEQNVKFDKVLELSKSNRRVRNLCGFLALTSEDTFNTLSTMSKHDTNLNNLRFNLAKALSRLEKESNKEVSDFAKSMKSKYFAHMRPLVEENNYDVSAEMAKLYVTMVNSYNLSNKPQNLDFQHRMNDTMDKFDLSALH